MATTVVITADYMRRAEGGMFFLAVIDLTISLTKILYGSEHPLYALKSTSVLVELADIDDSDKRRIFCRMHNF